MNEKIASIFPKQLRELRESKGFTRESLAEKVGCTVTAIYNWEMKGNKPTYLDFYKLMEALNVTFDELLGEKKKIVKSAISLQQALDTLSTQTGISIQLPNYLENQALPIDILEALKGADEADLRTIRNVLRLPIPKSSKKAN